MAEEPPTTAAAAATTAPGIAPPPAASAVEENDRGGGEGGEGGAADEGAAKTPPDDDDDVVVDDDVGPPSDGSSSDKAAAGPATAAATEADAATAGDGGGADQSASAIPTSAKCRICGKGPETGQAMCRFEPTDADPEPVTLHVFCGKTACLLPEKANFPQYEILTKAGIKHRHGTGTEIKCALVRSREAVTVPTGADGAQKPEKAKFYLVREFERHLRGIRAQARARAAAQAVARHQAGPQHTFARLRYSAFVSSVCNGAYLQRQTDSRSERRGELPEKPPAPGAAGDGAATQTHPEPRDGAHAAADSSNAPSKEALEASKEVLEASVGAPGAGATAAAEGHSANSESEQSLESAAAAGAVAVPAPEPVVSAPMPPTCSICGKGRETGRAMCRFEPTDADPEPVVLHVFCGKTASILLTDVDVSQYEILTKEGLESKHGVGRDVDDALARTREAVVVPDGADGGGARPEKKAEKAKFYLVREFEGHLRRIRAAHDSAADAETLESAAAATRKRRRQWV